VKTDAMAAWTTSRAVSTGGRSDVIPAGCGLRPRVRGDVTFGVVSATIVVGTGVSTALLFAEGEADENGSAVEDFVEIVFLALAVESWPPVSDCDDAGFGFGFGFGSGWCEPRMLTNVRRVASLPVVLEPVVADPGSDVPSLLSVADGADESGEAGSAHAAPPSPQPDRRHDRCTWRHSLFLLVISVGAESADLIGELERLVYEPEILLDALGIEVELFW
jgi:hypothetical protein